MLVYLINWLDVFPVHPNSNEIDRMKMNYDFFHNKTFIYVGF